MRNISLIEQPLGGQSFGSMELAPHTQLSRTQPSLPVQQSTLLRLPFEIRLMIYQHLFDGKVHDLFSHHVKHQEGDELIIDELFTEEERPKHQTMPLPVLLVCKQFHREVSAELYKKVTIEEDLPKWTSAIAKIGPRNGALIQQLEIVHECCESHRRCGDDGATWDCMTDLPNRLDPLLQCLAFNNINPGSLKFITDSIVPVPNVATPSDDDDTIADSSDLDPSEHDHSHDQQPYHDQTFINQLSSICNHIGRVEFRGAFNPLWVLALSKKFELIIKLENPCDNINAPEPLGDWTLIDPNTVELDAELRGYTPLDLSSRVYVKLPDQANYNRKRKRLLAGRRSYDEPEQDSGLAQGPTVAYDTLAWKKSKLIYQMTL